MIRYAILGPLAVAGDPVTAGRDRVVLAMLLLHADRVLSAGELIDAVWGQNPPSTARGQLQTCVSRLRRALPAGTIDTDPAGYRLAVGPDELDAALFTRLAAEARTGSDPDALRRALDLWRGPALVEIDSPAVRRAAAVLDEQRAVATEDWVDLELTAGRERELIGELSGLVEQFPLRERLRGQLMVALFRSGRRADALAEYRRAHQVLRDELGIEPGRELRELHQRMLNGGLPEAEAALGRVRCLPRTVGDFTGREAVVGRLVGAIDAAGPHTPVIVIDGMAGSGKTTLALHVAALVGDRYPDAHLFVDLHGHSAEQPTDPAAALLILLRQLGVDADRIPAATVDRIGLWRTELARRRALVLFDNVASSSQLADLLPTAPGSLALVTGRRRLTGLDGVHPESLPVLTPAEALALLERIAGDRVPAEPEAAAEVVRRCGGLPLALRLAGARLAHRPRWRVADLVRRLGESALPELAAEDRSVADAFAVSYGQLVTPTRRTFRLLGLYPGADFDAPAVAALSGLPLDDAQDALDDLVDVHLVDEPEPGTYRLHDLLREFAAALAAEVEPVTRREALRGVLDLQLHAALATMLPTYRSVAAADLGFPEPLRPGLLAAIAEPEARLERERRNLAAFLDAAEAEGLTGYAWKIPRAAWRFLWVRSYFDDVAALQQRALRAAERLGDDSAVATAANYLASVYYRRSEIDEARALLERSIRLREALGERGGLATAMGNLAGMHHVAGHWAKAIETAIAAQRVARGRRSGHESSARLNVLALGNQRLGRFAEALRYHRLRLLVLVEVGDLSLIADALVNLAVIKYRLGLVPAPVARRHLELAVRVAQRANSPFVEAEGHNELARLLSAERRFAEAIPVHRWAITMASRHHDLSQQATFRLAFGSTLRSAGDLPAAQAVYEEALRLGRQARMPYLVASARAGLGDCLAATDPAGARRLWEQARETFAELDAPERAGVERRLARRDRDQLHSAPGGGTMVG